MKPAGGRATLLKVSSFQVMVMFRRGLFYSFLAVYLRHFLKMSVTEMTLFATFPMIVNVTFQMLVWGGISDRYQLRRTLIVLGEVLAAGGTLLVWYLHTIPGGGRPAGYVIIAGLSVVEIFWSMSNVSWSALISDIYGHKDRAAVQGKLASIGAVGRIIGVGIGGELYDGLARTYEGWGFEKGALFFVAAGAMLVSAIPMLLVREGGIARGRDASSGPEPDAPSGSLRVFVIFFVAMIFINFGRNSVAVIRAPYLALETGFDMSSRQLGYVMNTQSAAMMLFGVFAGRMARRLGNARGVLAGAAAAIASLVLYAWAREAWLVYAASVLAGFSDVVIFASGYAYAAALIPAAKRGRLFGVYNATRFLSWGLAGTLIAGPIIDVLVARGSPEGFAFRMAFAAGAVTTLVGLGVLLYLTMRRSRETPSPCTDARCS